ncbi:alpha/beta hydrolase [Rhizobium sp. PAMB 3174]
MLTRRHFIAATGLAALGVAGGVSAAESGAMEIVRLWPGEPPGGGGPRGPLKETPWGVVSNISTPDVHVFRPEKPNGAAMLVIAGGGYRLISRKAEGYSAARWLNALGYTAFVLTYRLPGEGWHAGPKAPLADAQRAIRLIRARASEFGIEKERVGVLGFSAGGYLAGLASVRSDFQSYSPVDNIDSEPDRPDWTALVYPVITLKTPYDHTSTRRQMLGSHPTPEQVSEWSVETYVNADTPPLLLVHAADDPIANVHHSLIMEQCCEQAKVPVEFVELPKGGHGFGMSKPGKPSYGWSDHLQSWLRKVDAAGT